jgi:hypothetical protein
MGTPLLAQDGVLRSRQSQAPRQRRRRAALWLNALATRREGKRPVFNQSASELQSDDRRTWALTIGSDDCLATRHRSPRTLAATCGSSARAPASPSASWRVGAGVHRTVVGAIERGERVETWSGSLAQSGRPSPSSSSASPGCRTVPLHLQDRTPPGDDEARRRPNPVFALLRRPIPPQHSESIPPACITPRRSPYHSRITECRASPRIAPLTQIDLALRVAMRSHATTPVVSGRQDLNLRPLGPQPSALPDCATPRGCFAF